MENIKVVLWGMGSMGSGMGKYLVGKEGIEIVGAIAHRESKAGKDVSEFFDLDNEVGVKVTNDPMSVITEDVDVVLQATSSFVKDVYPQIEKIVKKKVNVISIAEEMAYPKVQAKELSEKIDKLAQEYGVSVLGTGINPGFVLDLMIIALSGACPRVEKIEASRINDLSPFGPTVMQTQGVGTTVEEFEKGIKDGSIVGHIGFLESINMIADRLGIKLDKIEQSREPIVSETHRETPHVKVEPGMVAGCRHIARGYSDGKEVILLEHPQQIHPEKEGTETGDYIKIKGTPDINMSIQPEIPGGIGTMAVAINMIPVIVNARAGLVTMKDLPVPAAMIGDARKLME
ncbi:MAG TPA: 2,4-diaminopentanoate dehydrogenase [Halanaerobiales bacterium]|nr:2,4-diaminopentanoate dehydrogenase [Halanaerobiales bacterium]